MGEKDKKGKFIVIEGTDGSGKKTQTRLLASRILKEGLKSETIDFPRYGEKSAYFVEKYLQGGYGTSGEVSPKKASLFYALDRFDHSKQIKEDLNDGKIVIGDRYTTSNMGHQTGKILNDKDKDEFLEWVSDLEYNICENPVPDMVVLLVVKPETSFRMIGERKEAKDTIGTKRDIHEQDIEHMKSAYDAYVYVANKFGWTIIDCAPKDVLLSREEIHELVWEKVTALLK
jgi:dTMP kinase